MDIAIDCVSGAWLTHPPMSQEQDAVVQLSSSSSSATAAAAASPSSSLSSSAAAASAAAAAPSPAPTASKVTLVITAIKESGVPVAFVADVLQVALQLQMHHMHYNNNNNLLNHRHNHHHHPPDRPCSLSPCFIVA